MGTTAGVEVALEKRYLDVRELSDCLGIPRWMIYKYIENRDIPFIPFGRVLRFDRVAIEKWAEKRMVRGMGGRPQGIRPDVLRLAADMMRSLEDDSVEWESSVKPAQNGVQTAKMEASNGHI